jgi:hypothetical protein
MSTTPEPPSEHSPSATQPKRNDFGYFRLLFGILSILYGCAMIYLGILGIPIFKIHHRPVFAPWEGEGVGIIAIMVGSILLMSLRTSRK